MSFIVTIGLAFVFKAMWKLVIYSPLWFSGYMISTLILDKEASAIAWLGLIGLIVVLLHYILLLIKGMIIGLKNAGKWIWVPLLLLCFFFTGILPVTLMYDQIYELMTSIYSPQANILAWIAAASLAFIMATRIFRLTDGI